MERGCFGGEQAAGRGGRSFGGDAEAGAEAELFRGERRGSWTGCGSDGEDGGSQAVSLPVPRSGGRAGAAGPVAGDAAASPVSPQLVLPLI